jgi:predicted DNA-binding antitoxin AbrB/MazE fold protein
VLTRIAVSSGNTEFRRTVMSETIEALYDGSVLWPVEPLALEPNTRVWIVIEILPPTTDTPLSFLRTARALNLDGPADWSANLESYLYGDKAQ